MLTKEQQSVQELLAHPGWDIFENLVLHGGLKKQLQDKEHASCRAGDTINSATYAGQIDILEVVLRVPKDYLQQG